VAELLRRLSEPQTRARLREEVAQSMPQQWSDIFIASVASPGAQAVVGRDVASLAKEAGCDPAEYAFTCWPGSVRRS